MKGHQGKTKMVISSWWVGIFNYLNPVFLWRLIWGQTNLISKLYRNIKSGFDSRSRKKERLLSWMEHVTGYQISDLDMVWKNGRILCDIIRLSCPEVFRDWDPFTEKTFLQGQTLITRCLQIQPAFHESDFLRQELTPDLEKRLFRYLSTIRQALNRRLVSSSISLDDDSDAEPQVADEYIARGMGLLMASRNRRAIFYIYSRDGSSLYNIRIEIQGPQGDYGLAIVTTDNQSLGATLTTIPINYRITSEHLRISYQPRSLGNHELSLTRYGYFIPGSPFHICVDDASLRPGKKYASIEWLTIDEEEEIKRKEEIKKNGKVKCRIVDFVTEQMYLTDDGKLVKIPQNLPINESSSCKNVTPIKSPTTLTPEEKHFRSCSASPSKIKAKNKRTFNSLSYRAVKKLLYLTPVKKIKVSDASAQVKLEEYKPTHIVFREKCKLIVNTCDFLLRNLPKQRSLDIITNANRILSSSSAHEAKRLSILDSKELKPKEVEILNEVENLTTDIVLTPKLNLKSPKVTHLSQSKSTIPKLSLKSNSTTDEDGYDDDVFLPDQISNNIIPNRIQLSPSNICDGLNDITKILSGNDVIAHSTIPLSSQNDCTAENIQISSRHNSGSEARLNFKLQGHTKSPCKKHSFSSINNSSSQDYLEEQIKIEDDDILTITDNVTNVMCTQDYTNLENQSETFKNKNVKCGQMEHTLDIKQEDSKFKSKGKLVCNIIEQFETNIISTDCVKKDKINLIEVNIKEDKTNRKIKSCNVTSMFANNTEGNKEKQTKHIDTTCDKIILSSKITETGISNKIVEAKEILENKTEFVSNIFSQEITGNKNILNNFKTDQTSHSSCKTFDDGIEENIKEVELKSKKCKNMLKKLNTNTAEKDLKDLDKINVSQERENTSTCNQSQFTGILIKEESSKEKDIEKCQVLVVPIQLNTQTKALKGNIKKMCSLFENSSQLNKKEFKNEIEVKIMEYDKKTEIPNIPVFKNLSNFQPKTIKAVDEVEEFEETKVEINESGFEQPLKIHSCQIGQLKGKGNFAIYQRHFQETPIETIELKNIKTELSKNNDELEHKLLFNQFENNDNLNQPTYSHNNTLRYFQSQQEGFYREEPQIITEMIQTEQEIVGEIFRAEPAIVEELFDADPAIVAEICKSECVEDKEVYGDEPFIVKDFTKRMCSSVSNDEKYKKYLNSMIETETSNKSDNNNDLEEQENRLFRNDEIKYIDLYREENLNKKEENKQCMVKLNLGNIVKNNSTLLVQSSNLVNSDQKIPDNTAVNDSENKQNESFSLLKNVLNENTILREKIDQTEYGNKITNINPYIEVVMPKGMAQEDNRIMKHTTQSMLTIPNEITNLNKTLKQNKRKKTKTSKIAHEVKVNTTEVKDGVRLIIDKFESQIIQKPCTDLIEYDPVNNQINAKEKHAKDRKNIKLDSETSHDANDLKNKHTNITEQNFTKFVTKSDFIKEKPVETKTEITNLFPKGKKSNELIITDVKTQTTTDDISSLSKMEESITADTSDEIITFVIESGVIKDNKEEKQVIRNTSCHTSVSSPELVSIENNKEHLITVNTACETLRTVPIATGCTQEKKSLTSVKGCKESEFIDCNNIENHKSVYVETTLVNESQSNVVTAKCLEKIETEVENILVKERPNNKSINCKFVKQIEADVFEPIIVKGNQKDCLINAKLIEDIRADVGEAILLKTNYEEERFTLDCIQKIKPDNNETFLVKENKYDDPIEVESVGEIEAVALQTIIVQKDRENDSITNITSELVEEIKAQETITLNVSHDYQPCVEQIKTEDADIIIMNESQDNQRNVSENLGQIKSDIFVENIMTDIQEHQVIVENIEEITQCEQNIKTDVYQIAEVNENQYNESIISQFVDDIKIEVAEPMIKKKCQKDVFIIAEIADEIKTQVQNTLLMMESHEDKHFIPYIEKSETGFVESTVLNENYNNEPINVETEEKIEGLILQTIKANQIKEDGTIISNCVPEIKVNDKGGSKVNERNKDDYINFEFLQDVKVNVDETINVNERKEDEHLIPECVMQITPDFETMMVKDSHNDQLMNVENEENLESVVIQRIMVKEHKEDEHIISDFVVEIEREGKERSTVKEKYEDEHNIAECIEKVKADVDKTIMVMESQKVEQFAPEYIEKAKADTETIIENVGYKNQHSQFESEEVVEQLIMVQENKEDEHIISNCTAENEENIIERTTVRDIIENKQIITEYVEKINADVDEKVILKKSHEEGHIITKCVMKIEPDSETIMTIKNDDDQLKKDENKGKIQSIIYETKMVKERKNVRPIISDCVSGIERDVTDENIARESKENGHTITDFGETIYTNVNETMSLKQFSEDDNFIPECLVEIKADIGKNIVNKNHNDKQMRVESEEKLEPVVTQTIIIREHKVDDSIILDCIVGNERDVMERSTVKEKNEDEHNIAEFIEEQKADIDDTIMAMESQKEKQTVPKYVVEVKADVETIKENVGYKIQPVQVESEYKIDLVVDQTIMVQEIKEDKHIISDCFTEIEGNIERTIEKNIEDKQNITECVEESNTDVDEKIILKKSHEEGHIITKCVMKIEPDSETIMTIKNDDDQLKKDENKEKIQSIIYETKMVKERKNVTPIISDCVSGIERDVTDENIAKESKENGHTITDFGETIYTNVNETMKQFSEDDNFIPECLVEIKADIGINIVNKNHNDKQMRVESEEKLEPVVTQTIIIREHKVDDSIILDCIVGNERDVMERSTVKEKNENEHNIAEFIEEHKADIDDTIMAMESQKEKQIVPKYVVDVKADVETIKDNVGYKNQPVQVESEYKIDLVVDQTFMVQEIKEDEHIISDCFTEIEGNIERTIEKNIEDKQNITEYVEESNTDVDEKIILKKSHEEGHIITKCVMKIEPDSETIMTIKNDDDQLKKDENKEKIQSIIYETKMVKERKNVRPIISDCVSGIERDVTDENIAKESKENGHTITDFGETIYTNVNETMKQFSEDDNFIPECLVEIKADIGINIVNKNHNDKQMRVESEEKLEPVVTQTIIIREHKVDDSIILDCIVGNERDVMERSTVKEKNENEHNIAEFIEEHKADIDDTIMAMESQKEKQIVPKYVVEVKAGVETIKDNVGYKNQPVQVESEYKIDLVVDQTFMVQEIKEDEHIISDCFTEIEGNIERTIEKNIEDKQNITEYVEESNTDVDQKIILKKSQEDGQLITQCVVEIETENEKHYNQTMKVKREENIQSIIHQTLKVKESKNDRPFISDCVPEIKRDVIDKKIVNETKENEHTISNIEEEIYTNVEETINVKEKREDEHFIPGCVMKIKPNVETIKVKDSHNDERLRTEGEENLESDVIQTIMINEHKNDDPIISDCVVEIKREGLERSTVKEKYRDEHNIAEFIEEVNVDVKTITVMESQKDKQFAPECVEKVKADTETIMENVGYKNQHIQFENQEVVEETIRFLKNKNDGHIISDCAAELEETTLVKDIIENKGDITEYVKEINVDIETILENVGYKSQPNKDESEGKIDLVVDQTIMVQQNNEDRPIISDYEGEIKDDIEKTIVKNSKGNEANITKFEEEINADVNEITMFQKIHEGKLFFSQHVSEIKIDVGINIVNGGNDQSTRVESEVEVEPIDIEKIMMKESKGVKPNISDSVVETEIGVEEESTVEEKNENEHFIAAFIEEVKIAVDETIMITKSQTEECFIPDCVMEIKADIETNMVKKNYKNESMVKESYEPMRVKNDEEVESLVEQTIMLKQKEEVGLTISDLLPDIRKDILQRITVTKSKPNFETFIDNDQPLKVEYEKEIAPIVNQTIMMKECNEDKYIISNCLAEIKERNTEIVEGINADVDNIIIVMKSKDNTNLISESVVEVKADLETIVANENHHDQPKNVESKPEVEPALLAQKITLKKNKGNRAIVSDCEGEFKRNIMDRNTTKERKEDGLFVGEVLEQVKDDLDETIMVIECQKDEHLISDYVVKIETDVETIIENVGHHKNLPIQVESEEEVNPVVNQTIMVQEDKEERHIISDCETEIRGSVIESTTVRDTIENEQNINEYLEEASAAIEDKIILRNCQEDDHLIANYVVKIDPDVEIIMVNKKHGDREKEVENEKKIDKVVDQIITVQENNEDRHIISDCFAEIEGNIIEMTIVKDVIENKQDITEYVDEINTDVDKQIILRKSQEDGCFITKCGMEIEAEVDKTGIVYMSNDDQSYIAECLEQSKAEIVEGIKVKESQEDNHNILKHVKEITTNVVETNSTKDSREVGHNTFNYKEKIETGVVEKDKFKTDTVDIIKAKYSREDEPFFPDFVNEIKTEDAKTIIMKENLENVITTAEYKDKVKADFESFVMKEAQECPMIIVESEKEIKTEDAKTIIMKENLENVITTAEYKDKVKADFESFVMKEAQECPMIIVESEKEIKTEDAETIIMKENLENVITTAEYKDKVKADFESFVMKEAQECPMIIVESEKEIKTEDAKTIIMKENLENVITTAEYKDKVKADFESFVMKEAQECPMIIVESEKEIKTEDAKTIIMKENEENVITTAEYKVKADFETFVLKEAQECPMIIVENEKEIKTNNVQTIILKESPENQLMIAESIEEIRTDFVETIEIEESQKDLPIIGGHGEEIEAEAVVQQRIRLKENEDVTLAEEKKEDSIQMVLLKESPDQFMISECIEKIEGVIDEEIKIEENQDYEHIIDEHAGFITANVEQTIVKEIKNHKPNTDESEEKIEDVHTVVIKKNQENNVINAEYIKETILDIGDIKTNKMIQVDEPNIIEYEKDIEANYGPIIEKVSQKDETTTKNIQKSKKVLNEARNITKVELSPKKIKENEMKLIPALKNKECEHIVPKNIAKIKDNVNKSIKEKNILPCTHFITIYSKEIDSESNATTGQQMIEVENILQTLDKPLECNMENSVQNTLSSSKGFDFTYVSTPTLKENQEDKTINIGIAQKIEKVQPTMEMKSSGDKCVNYNTADEIRDNTTQQILATNCSLEVNLISELSATKEREECELPIVEIIEKIKEGEIVPSKNQEIDINNAEIVKAIREVVFEPNIATKFSREEIISATIGRKVEEPPETTINTANKYCESEYIAKNSKEIKEDTDKFTIARKWQHYEKKCNIKAFSNTLEDTAHDISCHSCSDSELPKAVSSDIHDQKCETLCGKKISTIQRLCSLENKCEEQKLRNLKSSCISQLFLNVKENISIIDKIKHFENIIPTSILLANLSKSNDRDNFNSVKKKIAEFENIVLVENLIKNEFKKITTYIKEEEDGKEEQNLFIFGGKEYKYEIESSDEDKKYGIVLKPIHDLKLVVDSKCHNKQHAICKTINEDSSKTLTEKNEYDQILQRKDNIKYPIKRKENETTFNFSATENEFDQVGKRIKNISNIIPGNIENKLIDIESTNNIIKAGDQHNQILQSEITISESVWGIVMDNEYKQAEVLDKIEGTTSQQETNNTDIKASNVNFSQKIGTENEYDQTLEIKEQINAIYITSENMKLTNITENRNNSSCALKTENKCMNITTANSENKSIYDGITPIEDANENTTEEIKETYNENKNLQEVIYRSENSTYINKKFDDISLNQEPKVNILFDEYKNKLEAISELIKDEHFESCELTKDENNEVVQSNKNWNEKNITQNNMSEVIENEKLKTYVMGKAGNKFGEKSVGKSTDVDEIKFEYIDYSKIKIKKECNTTIGTKIGEDNMNKNLDERQATFFKGFEEETVLNIDHKDGITQEDFNSVTEWQNIKELLSKDADESEMIFKENCCADPKIEQEGEFIFEIIKNNTHSQKSVESNTFTESNDDLVHIYEIENEFDKLFHENIEDETLSNLDIKFKEIAIETELEKILGVNTFKNIQNDDAKHNKEYLKTDGEEDCEVFDNVTCVSPSSIECISMHRDTAIPNDYVNDKVKETLMDKDELQTEKTVLKTNVGQNNLLKKTQEKLTEGEINVSLDDVVPYSERVLNKDTSNLSSNSLTLLTQELSNGNEFKKMDGKLYNYNEKLQEKKDIQFFTSKHKIDFKDTNDLFEINSQKLYASDNFNKLTDEIKPQNFVEEYVKSVCIAKPYCIRELPIEKLPPSNEFPKNITDKQINENFDLKIESNIIHDLGTGNNKVQSVDQSEMCVNITRKENRGQPMHEVEFSSSCGNYLSDYHKSIQTVCENIEENRNSNKFSKIETIKEVTNNNDYDILNENGLSEKKEFADINIDDEMFNTEEMQNKIAIMERSINNDSSKIYFQAKQITKFSDKRIEDKELHEEIENEITESDTNTSVEIESTFPEKFIIESIRHKETNKEKSGKDEKAPYILSIKDIQQSTFLIGSRDQRIDSEKLDDKTEEEIAGLDGVTLDKIEMEKIQSILPIKYRDQSIENEELDEEIQKEIILIDRKTSIDVNQISFQDEGPIFLMKYRNQSIENEELDDEIQQEIAKVDKEVVFKFDHTTKCFDGRCRENNTLENKIESERDEPLDLHIEEELAKAIGIIVSKDVFVKESYNCRQKYLMKNLIDQQETIEDEELDKNTQEEIARIEQINLTADKFETEVLIINKDKLKVNDLDEMHNTQIETTISSQNSPDYSISNSEYVNKIFTVNKFNSETVVTDLQTGITFPDMNNYDFFRIKNIDEELLKSIQSNTTSQDTADDSEWSLEENSEIYSQISENDNTFDKNYLMDENINLDTSSNPQSTFNYYDNELPTFPFTDYICNTGSNIADFHLWSSDTEFGSPTDKCNVTHEIDLDSIISAPNLDEALKQLDKHFLDSNDTTTKYHNTDTNGRKKTNPEEYSILDKTIDDISLEISKYLESENTIPLTDKKEALWSIEREGNDHCRNISDFSVWENGIDDSDKGNWSPIISTYRYPRVLPPQRSIMSLIDEEEERTISRAMSSPLSRMVSKSQDSFGSTKSSDKLQQGYSQSSDDSKNEFGGILDESNELYLNDESSDLKVDFIDRLVNNTHFISNENYIPSSKYNSNENVSRDLACLKTSDQIHLQKYKWADKLKKQNLSEERPVFNNNTQMESESLTDRLLEKCNSNINQELIRSLCIQKTVVNKTEELNRFEPTSDIILKSKTEKLESNKFDLQSSSSETYITTNNDHKFLEDCKAEIYTERDKNVTSILNSKYLIQSEGCDTEKETEEMLLGKKQDDEKFLESTESSVINNKQTTVEYSEDKNLNVLELVDGQKHIILDDRNCIGITTYNLNSINLDLQLKTKDEFLLTEETVDKFSVSKRTQYWDKKLEAIENVKPSIDTKKTNKERLNEVQSGRVSQLVSYLNDIPLQNKDRVIKITSTNSNNPEYRIAQKENLIKKNEDCCIEGNKLKQLNEMKSRKTKIIVEKTDYEQKIETNLNIDETQENSTIGIEEGERNKQDEDDTSNFSEINKNFLVEEILPYENENCEQKLELTENAKSDVIPPNLVKKWKNYWDEFIIEQNENQTSKHLLLNVTGIVSNSKHQFEFITQSENNIRTPKKNSENGPYKNANKIKSIESNENEEPLDGNDVFLKKELETHSEMRNIVFERITLFERGKKDVSERNESILSNEIKSYKLCSSQSNISTTEYHCYNLNNEKEKYLAIGNNLLSRDEETFHCTGSIDTNTKEEQQYLENNICQVEEKTINDKSKNKGNEIDSKLKFERTKQFFKILEKESQGGKTYRYYHSMPRMDKHDALGRQSKPSIDSDSGTDTRCQRKRDKIRGRRKKKKEIKVRSAPTSDSESWKCIHIERKDIYNSGSEQQKKLSERFHVKGLFRDISGDSDGFFRGIPHREAVLASLRSVDDITISPYEMDYQQLRPTKSLSNIPEGFHQEYPYLPTTPPSKYRPRSALEFHLIPRNILLDLNI